MKLHHPDSMALESTFKIFKVVSSPEPKTISSKIDHQLGEDWNPVRSLCGNSEITLRDQQIYFAGRRQPDTKLITLSTHSISSER